MDQELYAISVDGGTLDKSHSLIFMSNGDQPKKVEVEMWGMGNSG